MAARRPPLLLISSAAPSDAALEAPRLDYRELSVALGGAPLSFPASRRGPLLAALEERTASDLGQACSAYFHRAKYSAFVSFSEKVGLPLALLLGHRRRRPAHVMIGHHLTSERKRALHRRTGCLHRFERIVVLCREQEHYLTAEAGVPVERVRFIHHAVDTAFWKASGNGASAGGILSVGRERRDYAALAEAARLLPDRQFMIVASSPWARSGGASAVEPSENITIRRNITYSELRDLYRAADVAVVPLLAGTAYAAGVTGVLEAMAMAKPTIVTRTPGIADYVTDGVTGRLVAPGDSRALADAIEYLLRQPDAGRRLGLAARAVVDNERNLETYVRAMARIVDEAVNDT